MEFIIMEITQDTNLIINLWTLIACAFFLWRLSSQITEFKKETDLELKDHEKRIKEFEDLKLDKILWEMQTNIKRIMDNIKEMKWNK